MEAYLQIFYVCMGIYGWSQWRIMQATRNFCVNTWSKSQHFLQFLYFNAFFYLSTLLELFTDAALPFLDAWLLGEQLLQLTWLQKNS